MAPADDASAYGFAAAPPKLPRLVPEGGHPASAEDLQVGHLGSHAEDYSLRHGWLPPCQAG
jgi:hypothetical protein